MEHLLLLLWGEGFSEGIVGETGGKVQLFGLLCMVDRGPWTLPPALGTAKILAHKDHQTDPKTRWRPRIPDASCSKDAQWCPVKVALRAHWPSPRK